METESQTVALELAAFGPRDIEEITGVTRALQRDRRRRKLAKGPAFGKPHHIGHIVEVYLIEELGRLMGGPGPAADPGAKFAPAIVWRIALDPRAWAADSLPAPAHDRAALVMAAIGQAVPPENLAVGFHCGETTLAAPDHASGREFFRRTDANGLLITVDFDEVAAAFLARAAGRTFARLADATPAESALLNLSTEKRNLQ